MNIDKIIGNCDAHYKWSGSGSARVSSSVTIWSALEHFTKGRQAVRPMPLQPAHTTPVYGQPAGVDKVPRVAGKPAGPLSGGLSLPGIGVSVRPAIDVPGSADFVPSQPEGSGVGQAYEQPFELGVLVSCHPGSGCASVWERGVVEKNAGAQAAITC